MRPSHDHFPTFGGTSEDTEGRDAGFELSGVIQLPPFLPYVPHT